MQFYINFALFYITENIGNHDENQISDEGSASSHHFTKGRYNVQLLLDAATHVEEVPSDGETWPPQYFTEVLYEYYNYYMYYNYSVENWKHYRCINDL